jgi:predicted pyridoxine 5'-phosphate oxidase superfamily flavin-nucleotide-binding protein
MNQVTEHLTPRMQQLIQGAEMAFIATSGNSGDCDCTFRVGAPGFIRILNYRTIAYPEYGDGSALASLGNMRQNPRVSLFLVGFVRDLIGLHVNGTARIVTPTQMHELDRDLFDAEADPRAALWIVVRVVEVFGVEWLAEGALPLGPVPSR